METNNHKIIDYDIVLDEKFGKEGTDLVFAFRSNGTETDLNKIAPFQKIVQNYLEMSHEIEK